MDVDADTAARYRQRAEEVRIIAEDMKDASSREILFTIAEDYERMAQQMDESAAADRRLRRLTPPPDFKLRYQSWRRCQYQLLDTR